MNQGLYMKKVLYFFTSIVLFLGVSSCFLLHSNPGNEDSDMERILNEVMDLSDSNLSHQNLSYESFGLKKLCNVSFYKTRLYKADFFMSDCSKANFKHADMRYASFRCAKLCNADLRRANLKGADFSGANLEGADLTDANITGIIFGVSTNFKKIKGLSKTQIRDFKRKAWDKTLFEAKKRLLQDEMVKKIKGAVSYLPKKIAFLFSFSKKGVFKIINRFRTAQES